MSAFLFLSMAGSFNMILSNIEWIMLGLIVGYIAGWFMDNRGLGVTRNITLGIVGALIGGWLFRGYNSAGVSGFTLWSMVVAVLGSIVLLLAWHSILFRKWA